MVRRTATTAALAAILFATTALPAAAKVPADTVKARAAALQPKVVAWRRDIHQHPELGNQEVRTAKLVADHLRSLGLEVREGVGKTGVVAVLRGGKPGKTVALRADMDALPVAEQTGLPFASKVRAVWDGQEVGVMHACGHDTHVAMLMGAAELLAGLKKDVPGTVLFIFQPAEEGPPVGEEGGAALMLKEGAFANPRPDAVFGIHAFSQSDSGTVAWRPEGFLASADRIVIELTGKQTHGASPWLGIDVVSLGADVVQGINQLAARQINVSASPTVATIATVHGGVRHNIIPDKLVLTGTLRTFDPKRREFMQRRIGEIAGKLAESYGAKAEVRFEQPYPVTFNDPALSKAARPWIEEAAGPGKVDDATERWMGAEDFSLFQQEVPGVFFALGVADPAVPVANRAPNHSPLFMVHEPAMETGVRTYALAALRYLESGGRR